MMANNLSWFLGAAFVISGCGGDEDSTGPVGGSIGTSASASAATQSSAEAGTSGDSGATGGTPTTGEPGSTGGSSTGAAASTTSITTLDTTPGTSLDTSTDTSTDTSLDTSTDTSLDTDGGGVSPLEAVSELWCVKYLECFPGMFPSVQVCVDLSMSGFNMSIMNADDPVACAAATVVWQQCRLDNLCDDPQATQCSAETKAGTAACA